MSSYFYTLSGLWFLELSEPSKYKRLTNSSSANLDIAFGDRPASVDGGGHDEVVLWAERCTGVPRVVPPAGDQLVSQSGEHDVAVLVPSVDHVVGQLLLDVFYVGSAFKNTFELM